MMVNLRAFLDMVAFAEGTSTSPLTKHNGYDVIVTGVDGHEIFTDFSTHPFCTHPPRPPKVINTHGLTSDAAGRYQLMARYWPDYKVQLSLPDFGFDSQDKIAVQQIKECHAIDDIFLGHFDTAVAKCSSRWASLPGNHYGQRQVSLLSLRDVYGQSGGTLA